MAMTMTTKMIKIAIIKQYMLDRYPAFFKPFKLSVHGYFFQVWKGNHKIP